MPVQNPLTRIEQVALDLGRLADEIGEYAGAQRTFLYLRSELLVSVEAIKRTADLEGESTPRVERPSTLSLS